MYMSEVSTASFVISIIGTSKPNHLGAQITVDPRAHLVAYPLVSFSVLQAKGVPVLEATPARRNHSLCALYIFLIWTWVCTRAR